MVFLPEQSLNAVTTHTLIDQSDACRRLSSCYLYAYEPTIEVAAHTSFLAMMHTLLSPIRSAGPGQTLLASS